MFIAVIGAALLHAVWNALVKGGRDKHLSMAAVVLGHAPFGCLAVVFSPALEPASLPYLAGGIALHVGYQLLLLESYRVGDLTQVYPIARGSAPLIVAGISLVFLGEALSSNEQLAVLVIAAGIMSVGLVRQRDGVRNTKAAVLALGTGCFIAAYSLVDGLGARAAGTALGFYGWLTIGNAALFAALMSIRRPAVLRGLASGGKRLFIVGGGASFAAYVIVVWAFTQAPIALVTALRETSIVFALLIGVVFLKERLDLVKVMSTLLTLVGAVMLRSGRS